MTLASRNRLFKIYFITVWMASNGNVRKAGNEYLQNIRSKEINIFSPYDNTPLISYPKRKIDDSINGEGFTQTLNFSLIILTELNKLAMPGCTMLIHCSNCLEWPKDIPHYSILTLHSKFVIAWRMFAIFTTVV